MNKNVFKIGIICLVIFIGIASYLWYLYFHDYEGKLIAENCKTEFSRAVEIVNTGNANYSNASKDDADGMIPAYYFSVKNNSKDDFNYQLVFKEVNVNDGCTTETRFKINELEYELKLDNKTIKSGGLETLQNNILDKNIIKGQSVNDYSIKIKIKSGVTDFNNKHFHYVINIKEQK